MTKVAKKKISLRQRRTFSVPLKRKIVDAIEQGKLSIRAVMREYSVSDKSVYTWLNKYSLHLKSGTQIVVQMESEEQRTKDLQKRIAELERIVGQKQITIDFLDKMIELGKTELGVDLKKKFFTPLSTGSEQIQESTAIK